MNAAETKNVPKVRVSECPLDDLRKVRTERGIVLDDEGMGICRFEEGIEGLDMTEVAAEFAEICSLPMHKPVRGFGVVGVWNGESTANDTLDADHGDGDFIDGLSGVFQTFDGVG